MSQFETLHRTRILQNLSELGLKIRQDDFSIQLTHTSDRFVFVRIEPEPLTEGAYGITDLNHSGWGINQEAKAIELGLRLVGAKQLTKIWFQKPYQVRRRGEGDSQQELEHLSEILKLIAQQWPAFIDGKPWHDENQLGVNFFSDRH